MSSAWFVNGGYLLNVWKDVGYPGNLDYLKLRCLLQARYAPQDPLDEAYFMIADLDDGANAFYKALSIPPPRGPGFRVKVYEAKIRRAQWPRIHGGGPVLHPRTREPLEQVDHKPLHIGMAFHIMRSWMHRKWTKLFLGLGDGEFREIVQFLVEQANVDLYLIGSVASISDGLRPYAREILDLRDEAERLVREDRR